MMLLFVIVAGLVSGLLLMGVLPLDRLPDLVGAPLQMTLFVALGVVVVAVLALTGRSERR